MRREEEEKERQLEEIRLAKEEKERQEKERKQRMREKKAEKVARQKAEGTYLTPKQKEELARARAKLEAMGNLTNFSSHVALTPFSLLKTPLGKHGDCVVHLLSFIGDFQCKSEDDSCIVFASVLV